ncbi:MAG: prepilin-type N-terminal cleavage/methylation domain-containing protein [Gammaproteobacteria bacterium]|nr:prepilin-type N-terminal cleavage/methylation domain-containing protein [Gammaproteobacteria bacterium]
MLRYHGGFSLIELMLALSMGSLVCIGIFNLFNIMENLHERQMSVAHEQDDSRFISQFLRKKIQMAGNESCIARSKKKPRSITIRKYTAKQAENTFNIYINKGTDLLQLRECVRFQDKQAYLPILFYVANTFRTAFSGEKINALFYQIDDHPREELITGMSYFKIRLYHVKKNKRNIRAVRIDFLLSSIDTILKNKQSYWFDGKWLAPKDRALYQSGILYAARRNA